jgi:hypothetical protein
VTHTTAYRWFEGFGYFFADARGERVADHT